MNEAMRLEIVQRRQSGMSQRGIADELGISRCAVQRAGEGAARRDGQATPAQAASTQEHHRSVRADLAGAARQVSEHHHGARRAGTASARLHRQVHGRASTPAFVAATRYAGACAAL